MNGSLAQRLPFDILSEVHRRRLSGILRFQEDAMFRQLFIDASGLIRFAASNLPNESLTTLLKEKAGVTGDQARQAAAEKQKQELLGTTLVRLGFLRKEILVELTTQHIRRVVHDTLAMRVGTYEFQEGALPFNDQLDGGLSTAEVLLECAREFPHLDWIRNRLGSLDAPVRMAPRPPQAYERVPLNSAEGYTMSRVDGQATLREICMVSPMGEETTLRALFGLALAGILEMPESSAEGPPPALAPARAPSNGGAPKPRVQGSSTKPPQKPGAPRPSGQAAGGRPAGTAPRTVTSIRERVRPSTTPDLEEEMLQRFNQMRDQDLYQVLGVMPTASTNDIRRAYYGLAKRFHPDRFMREDAKAKAEKVFAHITEAYHTLGHEESRRKYDEDLAARRSPRATEKTVDSHDIARLNFRHGKDQFDKGKFGEAVSFFQNACDQDPTKAEHFLHLAMAQSKNPRWKKEAEDNFLKALNLDPSNADIYAHLGALYSKGGLHSKAREMFKKALEWDPGHELAQEGLAAEGGAKKGLLGMFRK
jgi:curved DNA-binding protein CbpA